MFRKLLPLIGSYKKQAVLAPLLVIGEVVLEIFLPFLMAEIIDNGIMQKNMDCVVKTGALMIGAAFVSLLFGAGAARLAAIAATGFAKNIRQAAFDNIQTFSFSGLDRFSTSSLITRLTTDVSFVQTAFMMLIRVMVRAPAMIVFATLMAMRINFDLSIVFLAAVPVLGGVFFFISQKAHPYFLSLFQKYDALNASVQETLIAVRVVKAFVRGDFESLKFGKASEGLKNAQKKAEGIIIWNMPIMHLAMQGCTIAILWFGGLLIVKGRMQAGELFGFLTYVSMILMALMMFSMTLIGISMSQASAKRLVEVISETTDLTDGTDKDAVPENGSVDFENVNFSYSKNPKNLTLKNATVHFNSGETIGIVGQTGSAKTALVQLIPRLYDVLNGSLRVGGRDVREYSLKSLRSAVAMVLQNNVLFSGTILENLRWGDENADPQEIVQVCEIAQAHGFISSFPNGYDTVLGQGGVNLSGGQKQRLCLARALLKKPKVLILDDSTSAVDTATERKIRDALKTALPDTTKIIIAQRIRSVSDADRIVVLDNGGIDSFDTPDNLLKRDGLFRRIYESQQEKGAL